VVAAGEVETRAEELLASHLTSSQRAEYAAIGRITVVKRGFVWSILLRQVAVLLPLAALLATGGWRTAILLVALFVVTLAPFWLPRFAMASARRREWIISARTNPVLLARGRKIRFCVGFREALPDADRVLAWKNLVELSEGYFLRKANVR